MSCGFNMARVRLLTASISNAFLRKRLSDLKVAKTHLVSAKYNIPLQVGKGDGDAHLQQAQCLPCIHTPWHLPIVSSSSSADLQHRQDKTQPIEQQQTRKAGFHLRQRTLSASGFQQKHQQVQYHFANNLVSASSRRPGSNNRSILTSSLQAGAPAAGQQALADHTTSQ
jgi:hypothetical protein